MLSKLKNILPFSSKEYWENRYKTGGNSGAGSYASKAIYKADVLNSILEKYSINNLIEFGCGDGNNLQYYNIESYLGFDVSKTAIKTCIDKYKYDTAKSFILYNPLYFKAGNGLKSELTISFEVIFHLVEDDIFEDHINNLFLTSSKYVLICSTNYDEYSNKTKHVKHRKILKYIPENFELINEIETPETEELKGFLSNFYLFKRK